MNPFFQIAATALLSVAAPPASHAPTPTAASAFTDPLACTSLTLWLDPFDAFCGVGIHDSCGALCSCDEGYFLVDVCVAGATSSGSPCVEDDAACVRISLRGSDGGIVSDADPSRRTVTASDPIPVCEPAASVATEGPPHCNTPCPGMPIVT